MPSNYSNPIYSKSICRNGFKSPSKCNSRERKFSTSEETSFFKYGERKCDMTSKVGGMNGRRYFILLMMLSGATHSALTEAVDSEDTVRTSAASLIEDRGKLPCDVRTTLAKDRPVLILWYKDTTETPIYSFDARETSLHSGRHWSHERLMGKRAYFRLENRPLYGRSSQRGSKSSLGAFLELYPVRMEDGGTFRCRVDFLHSPTRNTVVTFTVVVPPEPPIIFNETNYRVGGGMPGSSIIGPYNEGDPLVLHCHVSGGNPTPEVEWFINDLPYKSKPVPVTGNAVRSSLIIESLQRDMLHSVIECKASNHNLTAPLSTTVTLEMNFRPQNVSIRGLEGPLVAGQNYELICDSWGSRPSAVISWWKGGTIQMEERRVETSHDREMSTSTLRYHASTADNQKYLTCRAENLFIPSSAKEDGMQLNVLYRPVVTLQMGGSMDPKAIKEGDDVYFECHINANPDVSKVVWIHNGVQLHIDLDAGVLVQNQTLALQRVRRSTAGNYSCQATNSEGGGSSNIVPLSVMYKPYCKKRPQTVYGASLHEPISVTCEVEAQPGPVTFRWTFNNTSEHLPISSAAVKSEDFTSTAFYIPKKEAEYGTILCWAFNSIGEQQSPCAFSVIPAGPPESLGNCSITNQTTDAIEIECDPGFDGGMNQTFHIEVYNAKTRFLYRNLSSSAATFTVNSFKPGLPLLMVIFASNAKGRSRPVNVETHTLKVAEKRTSPPAFLQFTPVVGLLLGIAAVLMLTALVIFVIMRMKRPPTLAGSDGGDVAYGDGTKRVGGGRGGRPEKFEKPLPETSSPMGSQKPPQTKVKSPGGKHEEKDPDVIPQNKGKSTGSDHHDHATPIEGKANVARPTTNNNGPLVRQDLTSVRVPLLRSSNESVV